MRTAQETPRHAGGGLAERLKQLDRNGDGKISAEEFPGRQFKQMDKDGDGFLTLVEAQTYFARRRTEPPGKERPKQTEARPALPTPSVGELTAVDVGRVKFSCPSGQRPREADTGPDAPGLRSVTLRVADPAAAREELTTRGAKVEGEKRLLVTDPDGNRIYIEQAPPEAIKAAASRLTTALPAAAQRQNPGDRIAALYGDITPKPHEEGVAEQRPGEPPLKKMPDVEPAGGNAGAGCDGGGGGEPPHPGTAVPRLAGAERGGENHPAAAESRQTAPGRKRRAAESGGAGIRLPLRQQVFQNLHPRRRNPAKSVSGVAPEMIAGILENKKSVRMSQVLPLRISPGLRLRLVGK